MPAWLLNTCACTGAAWWPDPAAVVLAPMSAALLQSQYNLPTSVRLRGLARMPVKELGSSSSGRKAALFTFCMLRPYAQLAYFGFLTVNRVAFVACKPAPPPVECHELARATADANGTQAMQESCSHQRGAPDSPFTALRDRVQAHLGFVGSPSALSIWRWARAWHMMPGCPASSCCAPKRQGHDSLPGPPRPARCASSWTHSV